VILVDILLRGETTLIPTWGCWQNTGRISNEFDLTRIQQKSCFRMTVQGHTQVWRLPKPLQDLIEVLPNHPYSPKLAPSVFLVFWAPKDVMCSIKFETWWWCDSFNENLATWGGRLMVMISLTHTCFLLMLHHRSWWRLCGNIGYGAKPLIMCNFHYSDIYWDKNKGFYFQGIPCKISFASSKTPCLVLEVYSLSSFIHVFLYWVKSGVPMKIRTKETSVPLLLIPW
jgi:hypothetical protein